MANQNNKEPYIEVYRQTRWILFKWFFFNFTVRDKYSVDFDNDRLIIETRHILPWLKRKNTLEKRQIVSIEVFRADKALWAFLSSLTSTGQLLIQTEGDPIHLRHVASPTELEEAINEMRN